MTAESCFEGMEDRETSLVDGGDISADAGEGERTGEAAECARDLLLHLDHTQIAIHQVVVKGDAEVVHEGQNGRAVFFQQIATLGLLGLIAVAALPFYGKSGNR